MNDGADASVSTGALAMRETLEKRRRAEERAEGLMPAMRREFLPRPLVTNDEESQNPHAFAPKHVEAWFHARGVVVFVKPHPTLQGHLDIKPIRLLEDPADR